MTNDQAYKNAVLDDKELQQALKSINPKFGDFVTRVAGEAWGLRLIDQKTKALITLAIDVVNQGHRGAGNPFPAHVNMALKQGATREEIEELLLFMCAYAGFNKTAGCFGALNEIFAESDPRRSSMRSAIRKVDYATRDQKGKVAFYVLLWKRKGISLELFDEYWRNVHGPVCARLPSQHQYWQFHIAHNDGGLWPKIKGIEYVCPEVDQFDGIAELTFQTEADRLNWFQASTILMDDEHNLFSKAIGYNTSPGNSITYVDGIEIGNPNGELGILKFHVMVQKADAVSIEAFRHYMTNNFAPTVVQSDSVLKFRLHLFDEVDNSRPDAAGVVHYEAPEQQYQAAFEIAFANHLEMEKFFASSEYAQTVKDQAKYINKLYTFPERTAYTFVYDGQMTLAGQRSSKVADLVVKIGASNQLSEDIVSLMNSNVSAIKVQQNVVKSNLGQYLQGVQHVGVTVANMAQSLEFYTEVLGGKLVIPENNLVGDAMQNNLFQKEELDAIALGYEKIPGLPNLRDGSDALDIKFISFGNACVELIFFRDGANPNATTTSVGSIPSHIGNVRALHLSFHVKDDVDLNAFAKTLEEECQRRGMTNVVCNRIIRVKSEAERKAVALKYNSIKFWEEEEESAQNGHEENHFGDFEGWALFYCKGPNGEQLEFNQVTRKVKQQFARAQQEYNQSTGTSFTMSNASTINNKTNGTSSTITTTQVLSENFKQVVSTEKLPGANADLVKRLFSRGEAFDSEGFITFFTDNPVYQFGNFDVCLDKESIKKSADNFFSQIRAVYHEIKMMWEVGDVVFVEMDVAYWRKDGSMISLPCCDIFRVEGDKFSELRIFMDVNPVFDPSIPVPSSASVLTFSQGQTLIPPGTMRQHFAEHPEGKARVANGYAPKWSIDGPQWSIESETTEYSEQVKAVGKVAESVIQANWEQLKRYLTDDVFYKVGSAPPVYGKQAVVDFLSKLVSTTARFQSHDVRKIWDEPGVVTIEMDANYLRLADNKLIKIACCDIYRMRGNKVSEWRVYADMSPFYED